MIVHGSKFRRGMTPKLPEGTSIRSPLAFFGDAYVSLRQGQYALAADQFIAMADRYDVVDGEYSFGLAYLAYAASRSGDRYNVERALDSDPQVESFDWWLAKAYFAAARKDVAAADAALKSAFYFRPNTEYRPILAEYQYAEACEWLYRDTKDPRFLTALLDWSKRHQVIQPTHAWAYAVQYEYTTTPSERVPALAMALYLDPASPRIKGASKAETAAARRWLQMNNPFTHRPPQAPELQARVAKSL